MDNLAALVPDVLVSSLFDRPETLLVSQHVPSNAGEPLIRVCKQILAGDSHYRKSPASLNVNEVLVMTLHLAGHPILE